MNYVRRLLIAISLAVAASSAFAENKVIVFAAASLTNAMTEIASQYEAEKSVKVTNSFAASSALAKQIENGAPADVFVSADLKWMNYLKGKNKVAPESITKLLGNRLVLIAPKGQGFKVQMDKSFEFGKAFEGRLCTGDLESVPVGIYAKQALTNLNWWNAVKTRIVGTQDVRAALTFVERGECTAGIVYETDAKVSNKVEIIAAFPEDSHEPVFYPAALVAGAHKEGKDFLDYLHTSKAGAVFEKYGFTVIK